jgi:hypothetical protein
MTAISYQLSAGTHGCAGVLETSVSRSMGGGIRDVVP